MPQHNESVAKKTDDLNKLSRPKSPTFMNPLFDTSLDDSQGVTVGDLKESKEPPASVKSATPKENKQKPPGVSHILTKVAKHFKLKGTEKGIEVTDPDDEKIKNDVEKLKAQFKKVDNNKDNSKNLAEEASMLASAQNALSEIKGEPTKEKLEKKLKERHEKEEKAQKILTKIQDLSLIDDLGKVDQTGIQKTIEDNHSVQTDHINDELSLLQKFKKLTSSISPSKIKGKGKDDKETSSDEIKEEADKKEDEKKDEKEEKRKKHWWEKVFFHNNKEGDKNNTVANSEKTPKFFKKFKTDLNGGEAQFFAYYSFVAITIFTITLFAAYNNKEIYDENKKLMKQTQNLYTFGLVILILFLVSLSLSFGHDKDFKQKLASFVLLNGSIYMGAYYTYIQSNGTLVKLTNNEEMVSEIIVAIFVLFLLASVAYVLFKKRKGKIGRILGILYLLTCVIGFFPLGGAVTSFNSRLKIPKDQKETLFVPLCTAFFGIGIFLFISLVIDSIPSLNKAFSRIFNRIFKVLEPSRVKYLIVAGLVMSIYYTYVIYKTYNSKYVMGDPKDLKKFPVNKNKGIFKAAKTTYTAGIALLGLIIFSLSLSFGGDLKEQLAAIFLTFFVIITGLYVTYLEGEGKIHTANSQEYTMSVATIAVFMILLVGCIFLTVFGKKSGKEVLIQDTIKILSNFGSIALFFVMFGIGAGISFTEFTGKKSGSWPGTMLWIGFGISLAIIFIFIGSFFI